MKFGRVEQIGGIGMSGAVFGMPIFFSDAVFANSHASIQIIVQVTDKVMEVLKSK